MKELEKHNGSPASLVTMAMAKGMDPAQLEKMWALQVTYEATEARKAYTGAMAAFKQNPPEIEKDRKVSFKTSTGQTQYSHATLANVTKKIGAALGACGLHASWFTAQSDDKVTVTCRITHVMGHFEETSLTAGLDNSGGKNSIQALGSTVSYLERYTLLALTGLATHEMDDDAGPVQKLITDEQKSYITDMINAYNVNEAGFLKFMGAETISDIQAQDFGKAKSMMEKKAEMEKKKGIPNA